MSSAGYTRVGHRVAAFVLGALLLSACENNLIFMERTGFNLAIRVNNDPTTPVEVNAGLKRTVVALVPPTGDPVKTATGTRANGEAVNLVSGYDLGYTESKTSVFAGTLTIRTQFASGAAAEAVSQSAPAVAKITDTTGTYSYDDSAKKLRSFWKPDGKTINKENQKALTDWMRQNGLSTAPGDITMFVYSDSSVFQGARVQAVKDLKLQ